MQKVHLTRAVETASEDHAGGVTMRVCLTCMHGGKEFSLLGTFDDSPPAREMAHVIDDREVSI